MVKKINKKIIFRFSLIFSSFLALFVSSTKNNDGLIKGLEDSVKSVSSVLSLDKVYAEDGCGDCCGSGCDGSYNYTFPTPSSSGIGLRFVDVSQAPPPRRSSGCFIAGTKVTLAAGDLKNIESIDIGEDLSGANDSSNKVEKLHVIPYSGDVYAFNGSGHYFFTPSHPFMTTNGWKSIDPQMSKEENPSLEVSVLNVGDILIKQGDKKEEVVSLEKITMETTVYNFKVSGDSSYHADGYLVHNAPTKRIP